MSFLSTIIHRVKSRLEEIYNGDPKKAGSDWQFRQSIDDLQRYIDGYKDYTKDEMKEADELYAKYVRYCK